MMEEELANNWYEKENDSLVANGSKQGLEPEGPGRGMKAEDPGLKVEEMKCKKYFERGTLAMGFGYSAK